MAIINLIKKKKLFLCFVGDFLETPSRKPIGLIFLFWKFEMFCKTDFLKIPNYLLLHELLMIIRYETNYIKDIQEIQYSININSYFIDIIIYGTNNPLSYCNNSR